MGGNFRLSYPARPNGRASVFWDGVPSRINGAGAPVQHEAIPIPPIQTADLTLPTEVAAEQLDAASMVLLLPLAHLWGSLFKVVVKQLSERDLGAPLGLLFGEVCG